MLMPRIGVVRTFTFCCEGRARDGDLDLEFFLAREELRLAHLDWRCSPLGAELRRRCAGGRPQDCGRRGAGFASARPRAFGGHGDVLHRLPQSVSGI